MAALLSCAGLQNLFKVTQAMDVVLEGLTWSTTLRTEP